MRFVVTPTKKMDRSIGTNSRSSPRQSNLFTRLLPPLVAALICTALILEAIFTAMRSQANGDLMLLFVPLLGATFLSIPACQAWWACLKIVSGK